MGSRSSTEMGQSRCHHNKKPRQRISGFQAGEPSIGNQLDNSFGSFTYPTHFFGDLLETLNQSCATALEVLPLDVSRAFCRPISSFTARRPWFSQPIFLAARAGAHPWKVERRGFGSAKECAHWKKFVKYGGLWVAHSSTKNGLLVAKHRNYSDHVDLWPAPNGPQKKIKGNVVTGKIAFFFLCFFFSLSLCLSLPVSPCRITVFSDASIWIRRKYSIDRVGLLLEHTA